MIRKILSILLLLCLLLSAPVVMAQVNTGSTADTSTTTAGGPMNRLYNVLGTKPTYALDTNKNSLISFMSSIIGVVFSLLGVIFILLLIYAGYNWMTAAGDDNKVGTAQTTLKVAIIGLIVISAAYAIWQFLFIGLLKG